MPVGFSQAEAAAMLNAFARGTPYAGNAALYGQLHVGDPGAAGTANVAGNTTRIQATFGTPTTTGTISNTADLVWSTTDVDTAEDYTHITLWTAASGGTFKGSGLVTANAVQVGDQFIIPAGDLDVSFIVAS